MRARKIREQVFALLRQADSERIGRELSRLAAKDVVNALFSAICRSEAPMRWHAVAAMGEATARLADEDMEEARIVVRRLLWSLNEESGGIGWGAPESLAEIICRHDGLAIEYVHMLLSYMRPDGPELCQDGNFLEHEALQRGLMWAAGRLAQRRRQLARGRGLAEDLPRYLESPDAAVRGLAARATGLLGLAASPERLLALTADQARLELYEDGRLGSVTVAQLAAQAIGRLEP